MMPDKQCSSQAIVSQYRGADRLPFDGRYDYEDGPIYIQDTSQGLQVQIWRARIFGDTIYLTSPNTPEFPVLTRRGIEEASLAFDQNGRYLISFLIRGNLYLYWHDPVIQEYAQTFLDSEVTSARITLDDKRRLQRDASEVILAYTKNNSLYYRGQLDRYQVPYLLQSGIAGRLMRVGMNSHYRLQFIFQAQPYGDYSCTIGLNCL